MLASRCATIWSWNLLTCTPAKPPIKKAGISWYEATRHKRSGDQESKRLGIRCGAGASGAGGRIPEKIGTRRMALAPSMLTTAKIPPVKKDILRDRASVRSRASGATRRSSEHGSGTRRCAQQRGNKQRTTSTIDHRPSTSASPVALGHLGTASGHSYTRSLGSGFVGVFRFSAVHNTLSLSRALSRYQRQERILLAHEVANQLLHLGNRRP